MKRAVIRQASMINRQASTTIDSLVATKWHSHFFGRDNEPSEEFKDGSDDDTSQEGNVEEGDNLVANPGEDNLGSGEPAGGEEVTQVESISRRSSVADPRRPKILTFHEKRLLGFMGPDAVQYLRFQKYIIIFILFTTAVSLGVILPLNFQGTQLGNATDFGHTTLANLNPNDDRDSWILWIHVFTAFLMFPCSIFLMRRFSIGLKMRDTSLKITRTIAIENIPPLVCTPELIKEHFRQIETYKDFKINDIQLVYDVSKLTALSKELDNVVDSRKFSELYEMRHGEELTMVPVSGARCCRYAPPPNDIIWENLSDKRQ